MDLDEMRDKWAEHDRKLDEVIRFNRRIMEDRKRLGSQKWLHLFAVGAAIEVLINVVPVLIFGSFNADHWREPRYLIPGAILQAFSLSMLISSIIQLVSAIGIDYSRSVVSIQREIERLKIKRIRITQAVFLTGPLLWAPLLIVGAKGLAGLDLYMILGFKYLFANFVVGLLCIPVGIWIIQFLGAKAEQYSWLRKVRDDLAGQTLRKAGRFLSELEAFVQEG